METQKALEVLGITGDADADAVKSAYVGLVKKYHPDLARTESDRVSYTKIIIDVSDAYSTLTKSLRDGTYVPQPRHDADNAGNTHEPNEKYNQQSHNQQHTQYDDNTRFDIYRSRMQSISEFIKSVPNVTRDETKGAMWRQKVVDMVIKEGTSVLTNEQNERLLARAKSPQYRASANFSVFDYGFEERHNGLTADDYVLLTSKTDYGAGSIEDVAYYADVLYDINVKRYYWYNADFSNLTPPTPTIEDVKIKRQFGLVIPERNSMNAVPAPKPPKKERRSPFSAIGSFFRR